MKINFDVYVKGSDGKEKMGDKVSELVPKVLESYNNYKDGDRSIMWSILGDIGRKGEVDLNDKEMEILKKYWDQVNVRIDLDITVRRLLGMEV